MSHAWYPPSLSRAPFDHRLWNAFLSHAGSPVPLAEGTTAVFARTTPPEAKCPCLTLKVPDGPRALVVFRAFPFHAMFGAELTVEDLPVLPEELAQALNEGMGAVILNLLPEHWTSACSALKSAALVERNTDFSDWEWFTVTIEGVAAEPAIFDVGCDRSELIAWLRSRGPTARRVWSGLRKRLTTTADVTIGSFLRRADDLAALAVGSLAVMPATEPGIHTLRVEETFYDFLKEEDGLVCLGSRSRGQERLDASEIPGMIELGERENMEAEKRPVALQVVLDFDLGRVAVPLEEIEAWQIGSIVPMKLPVRAGGVEVTIRANGAVVGSGDLVQIDDRFAVRITRIEF